MAALAASIPPWIPEDDLLLKNAVEDGASLEALAKGAVRFSRKFTVGELRDRWHSLLYDPIISAEASARMVELDLSVPNSRVSNSEVSVKRKLETVRQMYYAMRKRTCSRSGNSADFSFLDAPDSRMAFDIPIEDGKCVFGDSNQNQLGGNGICFPEMEVNAVDILNRSTAISKCDYADLSESLLNFSNEDELLLVDAGGQLGIHDKSCFDDDISMNFWNNVDDCAQVIKESDKLYSDRSVGMLEGSGLCSEVDLPESTLADNTLSMNQSDVEMECTLNSEDLEIPCNDNICFPRKDKLAQRLMKKQENPPPSLVSSQVSVLNIRPVTSSGHQPVGCAVNSESPRDSASIQTSNANRDSDQSRITQAAPISAEVELVNAEFLPAHNSIDFPLYAKACSIEQVAPVPESDALTVDQEESDIDVVPSYSDVEAMILELDLCPDDADSLLSSEVSRYHNEDSVRKIIRLEQCARSSMHRTIASQGAFAVLYGRRLKHYIRETEVILGRATDDMQVDIDLGREGPANKISRRQALIKMETDGSFLLKNLGKSLVFLNGKEVWMGQTTGLAPSSLIEIGGMAFVFETNSKSVLRHLKKANKNREQDKFQWSERFHH